MALPFNNPKAFPPTNTIIGQEQQRDYDPVSVMLGSFAETGIDVGSFGIFQPDIVPDYAERNSPIAYFIGNTAGMIAGMYPSFGAAGLAANAIRNPKAIFNIFKYGSRVLKVAEEMSGIEKLAQAAKPASAFATQIGHTVATFALHDAAREITRQVQENDPNLYHIGHRAVSGAIGGYYLGLIGKFTHDLHPIAQAVSMGAAMTMAEALTNAAEGVDVLDEDYIKRQLPKTFLQGTAIGLWNSRNWKTRRNAMQEFDVVAMEEKLKKHLDKTGKIDPSTIEPIMKVLERFKKDSPDLAGLDIPKTIKDAINAMDENIGLVVTGKLSTDITKARQQIKIGQELLQLDEPTYRGILKEVTGKKSSKDLNLDEAGQVWDFYKSVTYENLKPINETLKGRYSEAGFLEKHFKAADLLLTTTGLREQVQDIETAKNLLTLEETHLKNFTYSWGSVVERKIKQYMPQTLPSAKEAFGRKVKGRTSEEMKVMSNIIEGNIPQSQVHPEINRLAGIYKSVTDYYWHRTNQVRMLTGEEPLTYKEFYMMHQINRPEMIRQGYKRKEIPTVESLMSQNRRGQPAVSSNIRSVTEIERTINEYPMLRDPAAALVSMAHNDLQVIYFTEPVRILNAQIKKLQALGVEGIDTKILDNYMEQVIKGRPTEGTKRFNKSVEKAFDTPPGEIIDKVATYFGKDLLDNTAGQINSLVGKSITRAFIAFKPKQAIRNVMQFIFGYGRVSGTSIAKALMPIEHPKLITDIIENSMYFKMTKEYMGEEYIHASKGFMGRVDAASYDSFSSAAVKTVKINMLAAGYDTHAKILSGKNKWADPEGIKLRKDAKLNGDSNYNYLVSPREKRFMTEQMDAVSNDSNYLYTVTGMPMIYRSAIAAPLFKLQSFSMNYVYKTIGGMGYEMFNGKPRWAKNMGADAPTFTTYERTGLLRHFIGLGMLVAAVEKATGLDYSSLLGMSYKKSDEEGVMNKIKFGLFDIRPNPTMTLFLSAKDMLFADEEWKRDEAVRNMKNAFPIPYKGAMRDWEKALTEDKVAEMFVYKPYQKPVKTPQRKRTSAFGEPFGKPFGGGFKGF